MFPDHPFPRAILHIDGDAFFASCEVAQNPALIGKPVVVGQERGIATAVTYEAKARGVSRGMPMWEIRKVCPEVIVAESHYDVYAIYSQRMNNIVRRYTPDVEKYSIDECFADLTDLHMVHKMPYEAIARRIKAELEESLGMTFSVGLGPTKVIAKVASKWKKPNGFTIITAKEIQRFLQDIPIGKIWGVGPNTSAHLQRLQIKTALDFALEGKDWIEEHLSKPYQELWHELRGTPIYKVHTEREDQKSVMKTRTFSPSSTEKEYVFSELSKNIERACVRLRALGFFTNEVSGFLKTQEFKYSGFELKLPHAMATPAAILECAKPHFERLWRSNTQYRATGVTLRQLRPASEIQPDLFGAVKENASTVALFKMFDRLSGKYKKQDVVFLASSMRARARDHGRDRHRVNLERFNIPYWGLAT